MLHCVVQWEFLTPALSSSRHLARVSLSQRVLSCLGFAISSSIGSYQHNALAAKVYQAAGKSSGYKAVVVMSGFDTVAGGYASAFADLAQSTNALEKVNGDVEKLREYLNTPEVYDFVMISIIEDKKKKGILKTLSEYGSLNKSTFIFFNLFGRQEEDGLIKEVLKEFKSIFNNSLIANCSLACKLFGEFLLMSRPKILVHATGCLFLILVHIHTFIKVRHDILVW